MTMRIATGFLVGTLISLSTLLALPVSVFSQVSTSSASTTPIALEALPATVNSAPFDIEMLEDPGRIIGDFVVGPGKIELSLKPGESRTVELMITNRMGEPKRFKFTVEDAAGGRTADQAVELLGSVRGPYSLRDYVHFPVEEFELKHMERARIPVTVTLPPDAEPGGHYGSVLVSTVSREADDGTKSGAVPSSAIVSRIGTLFFVTTPGDVATEGKLTSFTTVPQKNVFFRGPVNFALLFENTGSIHLNPYGKISITNMFGDEVGFMELDPWFALPGSLRTREVSWTRDLLIGRYTATASVNRGYNDVIDEASLTFWVIPWKMLLVLFSGLFVFFLLLKFIFSRFEFKRK